MFLMAEPHGNKQQIQYFFVITLQQLKSMSCSKFDFKFSMKAWAKPVAHRHSQRSLKKLIWKLSTFVYSHMQHIERESDVFKNVGETLKVVSDGRGMVGRNSPCWPYMTKSFSVLWIIVMRQILMWISAIQTKLNWTVNHLSVILKATAQTCTKKAHLIT